MASVSSRAAQQNARADWQQCRQPVRLLPVVINIRRLNIGAPHSNTTLPLPADDNPVTIIHDTAVRASVVDADTSRFDGEPSPIAVRRRRRFRGDAPAILGEGEPVTQRRPGVETTVCCRAYDTVREAVLYGDA